MTNLNYWVALNTLKDLGPLTIKRLYAAFKSPEIFFQATEHELMEIGEISIEKAKALKGFNNWKAVDEEIKKAEENNVSILTIEKASYPWRLKELYDPPSVIYVKGHLQEIDQFAIAIVGSRQCTNYGIAVAEKMSTRLASYGFTIISGMARGIDTVAHKAALKEGGRTIAVLGCGIDVIYPAANKNLYKTIPESGVLLTEFPMGTNPYRQNFPRRNRLISALSLGVLIVEASEKSGSLITAKHAINQGKEVFAIPGSILNKNSKGTHSLIKEGARLIDSPDEIVAELGPLVKGFIKEKDKEPPLLNDDENVLLRILNREPKHIDMITRELNLPVSKVVSILLNLELKGVVRQWEGKKFSVV